MNATEIMRVRAGETVQSIKRLLRKSEDLSSIPKTHLNLIVFIPKEPWRTHNHANKPAHQKLRAHREGCCESRIPVLERQKQADPWGSH